MKSHWVYHKGCRIFVADFSQYGSDSKSIRAETEYIIAMLKNEPQHSVLSIANVDGTYANEDILHALADLIPASNKYVKRRAVVGLAGFRRHFMDAVAKVVGDVKFSVFDTMEQAMDWLVT